MVLEMRLLLAIRGGEKEGGFKTIADNSMRLFPEPGLANLRRCLQDKYVIKFEILGAGANEKKVGKFLGQVINGLKMV